MLSVLCITSCSKKEALLLDYSYTLTLYPNPVYEGRVFDASLSAVNIENEPPVFPEELSLRLINKNGDVFWEKTTTLSSVYTIFTVSTDGIPPGVYVLDCEIDNGLLREELVIYPGL
jgi:hypothetical protein